MKNKPEQMPEKELNENVPRFTNEERFKIMAHLITTQAKGIYVEPMNYRPYGLEGDIPNVLFQFYIHIPINMNIIQRNESTKNVRSKRTFICLFVDPPAYPHIRPNKDIRMEMERFLFWKREIQNNENFMKMRAFCEKYDWYLISNAFDVDLYSQIKGYSQFDGRNDYEGRH